MKKITFTQLKKMLQESKKTIKEHFTDEDFDEAEQLAADAIASRDEWRGGDLYDWLEQNNPATDIRVINFAADMVKDQLGMDEGTKPIMSEAAEQYEGTRFFVESWEAASTEDDWENGESNRVSSAWDDSDIKVDGTFDTVAAAVEAVCEANYFTFKKENWVALADESTLHGDVLVDEDNQEASPKDIEAWKQGEKRLWNCHLTVHVMKRTAPQPCSEEELLAEFEEG